MISILAGQEKNLNAATFNYCKRNQNIEKKHDYTVRIYFSIYGCIFMQFHAPQDGCL